MDAKERNLNVRLPAELHEQLRERADEEDRSIAQVLRVAARRYLATPNPVTAQPT